MSTVTREEFDSFKNEILKQLAMLNTNIAELVTELKVNNANTCKDIEAIREKIDSLQDFKSIMYNKCEGFEKRIGIIETTASVTKDTSARTMSFITWGIMLITFLLKLAKVW